jgi:hypothetical protein
MREAWLRVRLDRVSHTVKQRSESLLAWLAGDDPHTRAVRAAAVEVLHVMIDEVSRSQDAAGAATGRSRELVRLRDDATRAENGRKALLRGLDVIENAVDSCQLEHNLDEPQNVVSADADWASRMRAATSEAHELHRAVWDA